MTFKPFGLILVSLTSQLPACVRSEGIITNLKPQAHSVPAQLPVLDFNFDALKSSATGHSFTNLGVQEGSLRCDEKYPCGKLGISGEHSYLRLSAEDSRGDSLAACYTFDLSESLSLSEGAAISVWTNIKSLPSAQAPLQTIVGVWDENGDRRDWRFGVLYEAGTVRYLFETTSGANLNAGSVYMSQKQITPDMLNRWVHVSFVRSSKESGHFVINGKPETGDPKKLSTSQPFVSRNKTGTVGCTLAGGAIENSFFGLIDDLKVYNRQLSAQESADLFGGDVQLNRTYLLNPNFRFVGSPAAELKSNGVSVRSYDVREIKSRLAQLNSTPADSFVFVTGPEKSLDYFNLFGANYNFSPSLADADNPVAKFMREWSDEAATLPRVDLLSNLGFPKSEQTVAQTGKVFTLTDSAGRVITGTTEDNARKNYSTILLKDAEAMVSQMSAYKTIAPAGFERFIEDDFLAARKRYTNIRRREFLIPICRKIVAAKIKMSVNIYCPPIDKTKLLRNAIKGGFLNETDPSLQSEANVTEPMVLASMLKYDLNSEEREVLSNCIDEAVIFDQNNSGQGISPWNDSNVAEMNGCVSYLRKNSSLKVRVGVYQYGSLEDRINNVNLARTIAADGYDLFFSPWPKSNILFDDNYISTPTDPVTAVDFGMFQFLKHGPLADEAGAIPHHQTHFIQW